MTRLLVVIFTVGTVAACAGCGPRARSTTNATEDVRAVEAALRSWYDASERHDSAGWAALLLPEFFIFEDTNVYDRASLTRMVVDSFAEGTDHATLSDFKTSVVGDVAWTSFRNDEVFTPTGGAAGPVRRFLETAVLRRVDGQWRLERYHATRINRPAPTK